MFFEIRHGRVSRVTPIVAEPSLIVPVAEVVSLVVEDGRRETARAELYVAGDVIVSHRNFFSSLCECFNPVKNLQCACVLATFVIMGGFSALFFALNRHDDGGKDFCSHPGAIDFQGPFHDCLKDGQDRKVAEVFWTHYQDDAYSGQGWWVCQLLVHNGNCARTYSSTCSDDNFVIPERIRGDLGVGDLHLDDC